MKARGILPISLAVVASLGIVGCGGGSTSGNNGTGGGGGGGSIVNNGAAQVVYVVQSGATSGSILEFSATASGSVAPTATIAPGVQLAHVAADASGNIYVATPADIREYAVGATGAPTPIRTIPVNTTTGLYAVDGLAVSPAGDIVVGQDGGDVDVWLATQSGSVAPSRRIVGYSQNGASPGLSGIIVANQVAMDSAANVYVAAEGVPPPGASLHNVLVFGSAATGNVAPSRTLGTSISNAIALDGSGNVYVTTSSCTSTTCIGTISEYAATATATDPPIRTIAGNATLLGELYGINVDSVGNIFVVSTTPLFGSGGQQNPTVLRFAATASGNVAPTSSFTSSAWTTTDANASIALH